MANTSCPLLLLTFGLAMILVNGKTETQESCIPKESIEALQGEIEDCKKIADQKMAGKNTENSDAKVVRFDKYELVRVCILDNNGMIENDKPDKKGILESIPDHINPKYKDAILKSLKGCDDKILCSSRELFRWMYTEAKNSWKCDIHPFIQAFRNQMKP